MKGKSVTKAQKEFWDRLCNTVGCIVCRNHGVSNHHLSVHHIDGRTKPWAHWYVIPLCAPHHQDMGVEGFIPVHPYKARFERAYGTQHNLFLQCLDLTGYQDIENKIFKKY